MSVMGAEGGTAGYIADSLDSQRSNFDFNRGGGATTAMYDSCCPGSRLKWSERYRGRLELRTRQRVASG